MRQSGWRCSPQRVVRGRGGSFEGEEGRGHKVRFVVVVPGLLALALLPDRIAKARWRNWLFQRPCQSFLFEFQWRWLYMAWITRCWKFRREERAGSSHRPSVQLQFGSWIWSVYFLSFFSLFLFFLFYLFIFLWQVSESGSVYTPKH